MKPTKDLRRTSTVENPPTEVPIVDKKTVEKEEDKGGAPDAPEPCNVPVAIPILAVAAEESESDLSETEDSLT